MDVPNQRSPIRSINQCQCAISTSSSDNLIKSITRLGRNEFNTAVFNLRLRSFTLIKIYRTFDAQPSETVFYFRSLYV